ncbi:helix-turn-helix domain-containing protein [Flavobacterium terrigena]|uniref:Helix-turn-helix n=2 Tax=Flavobacterium terrigena TaxID=402734 RepID=A0A1H6XF46_9FLAO|nr:Helix-turn-helix [Flavobacterium terrigena]
MFIKVFANRQFHIMKIDEEKFAENFGKKIREVRIKAKLSQEMLANDANIPINQVGRIERAEINTSINTIYKLAKALGIDVKDLFDFEKKD